MFQCWVQQVKKLLEILNLPAIIFVLFQSIYILLKYYLKISTPTYFKLQTISSSTFWWDQVFERAGVRLFTVLSYRA